MNYTRLFVIASLIITANCSYGMEMENDLGIISQCWQYITLSTIELKPEVFFYENTKTLTQTLCINSTKLASIKALSGEDLANCSNEDVYLNAIKLLAIVLSVNNNSVEISNGVLNMSKNDSATTIQYKKNEFIQSARNNKRQKIAPRNRINF